MVSLLAAAVASAQAGISVTINGEAVPFSGTGPQMVNGRVLVPLRGVFEKLGAKVEWRPERREVIATRGQSVVDLVIGNSSPMVNGQSVTLDVPAQIVNGSTMVPIRFVSEAIGAEVKWNEAEQMVVITVNQDQAPAPAQPAPVAVGDGPVRMARVSFIEGGVMWRPGDDVDWSDAAPNLPLRQGAEFWLNPGARDEVQFDDGSFLRLGNGAVSTLHTMFADSRGEFTEIRLNTGTASLRLTSGLSSYQVDTPLASVTASGVSSFRIDATNGLRLIVRSGSVQVQGDAGAITVGGGQFLRLDNASSVYTLISAPGVDAWDRFSDGRDGVWFHPSPYLPSSIAIVAGDLNSYGSWVRDPQYGYCWHPTNSDPGWAPYRNGHWVWVSPFGWTWCGNEAWGWAPYHYGTWFSGSNGWAWRPGPAQQCWSPAVVYFSTANGAVAWCPLSPAEVRYPAAVSVGFQAGNWAVNFSIGGAASYYPAGSGYCTPRPWNNVEINRTTNVYNVTRITNVQNVYVSNNGFVPRNSRVAGGATVATTAQFAGRGRFAPVTASNAAIFTKGQTFAPPTGGTPRFAGPTNVKPTRASFSPAAALTQARPAAAVLNRTVVRAPVPARVATFAGPMASAHVLPRSPGVPARPTTPRVTKPVATTPRVTNPRVTTPRVTPPVVNPRLPKPNVPKPLVTNPRKANPASPRPVVARPKANPVAPRPPIVNRPKPTPPIQPNRVVAPPRTVVPKRVPPPAKPAPKGPPHKPAPKNKKDDKAKKNGGQTTGR